MHLSFKDQASLKAWAHQLAAGLERPALVLLNGEMGAGKTQMVRWFSEALGAGDIASPTFAVHHEYAGPGGTVDHVDLYRLKSDADLESSGFWDLFRQPRGLVFVEWADRLPDDVWPTSWNRWRIDLRKGVGEERFLTLAEF